MSWIIAGIVILLLLYRRVTEATNIPTSDKWKDWLKGSWWKYLFWASFALVVIDLFRKFVFPNVPVEWAGWIPGFSWNTVEVIIAVVGVYFLWKKSKKTTAGTGPVSGSGIVVTGVADTHNPPPMMYGGVPQVKWISSTGESVWNAVAIPIVVIVALVVVFYAASKTQGVVSLWKLATTPATLPTALIVLLVANAIMAFLHKSDCFPVLVLGVFGAITAYVMCPWVGVVVPAIAVVLPAVMLSCYALWKNDFSDWRVPGAFLVLLFFAF